MYANFGLLDQFGCIGTERGPSSVLFTFSAKPSRPTQSVFSGWSDRDFVTNPSKLKFFALSTIRFDGCHR